MVMVQYSCTKTADDDSSDNDDTKDGSKDEAKDDDPEDDSAFTCWWCKRCSIRRLKKTCLLKKVQLRSMMNMYDVVPKLPMTYRVSPVSCTVVIVVVATIVEYLPS